MKKVIRDIRIDFQSTPQLWLATREGWEPGGLHGLGKTPLIALAELLGREIETEPEYCPKCDSGDTSFVQIEDCSLIYQKCGRCGEEWGHT